MGATNQSNQMDVDEEEARPNPEVTSLPQERHIWRVPELPTIPQGGSNRNMSMPAQKLVQRSKRRRVGNMPKPLEGGHELLLTHQELSESREDHRTLRRLEPIVFQRQEERVGNDSSFGEKAPSGVYQLQTTSRSVQGQAQRTSEEEETSQDSARQGQRQSQLAQTLPTREQDPQIGAFSSGQCIQRGQNSDGIHIQGAGNDEKDFSTQIIQQIHFVKSSIVVEHDHILEIAENTNQFATPLAKGDSERQKLKNKIIVNVEQIHKNYEPHMPRHSTPLTEEKPSVKGCFTPLLGENVISARDIPKLEEWPTFSGEGEYNHIEFIRTIDMLQEDFNISNGI
ncbi:hypothetical protein O181_120739 [Austropuccinia psidii MF-1]|uniref:Uncharacterized protein n=1 Tax=Austropuccinia psidii MF-1 TaxID=1389203 RepID=A0A9Q3KH84_9BASI|nr:hypothetical protein [Austropuccinia psidii MF-1]